MWGSGVSDGGKSARKGLVAERSPESMGKMGRKMAVEGGRGLDSGCGLHFRL